MQEHQKGDNSPKHGDKKHQIDNSQEQHSGKGSGPNATHSGKGETGNTQRKG